MLTPLYSLCRGDSNTSASVVERGLSWQLDKLVMRLPTALQGFLSLRYVSTGVVATSGLLAELMGAGGSRLSYNAPNQPFKRLPLTGVAIWYLVPRLQGMILS